MRLSELKTGERGVIVKVAGHGGFRKRIVEMGFIKGQTAEVLLNAPLQDPVKYKIMGYEVSLRHSEADMIEVVTEAEAAMSRETPEDQTGIVDHDAYSLQLDREVERRRHVINVALVGNPNCGKTSLFNFASGAHERVGNYSGVTVDAKEGKARYFGYEFNLVDLPGTYSLSAYSPEELYVRKQIVEKTPDVIINVIDTSNLERNLYLTTQLIDMHLRMVCALNMFDETERRGDHVDYEKLGELFGVPMVPTVFTNGRGVEELFKVVIDMYEGQENSQRNYRHIHINHGHELEHGIKEMQEHLKQEDNLRQRYSTRYLAIKLLEHDKDVEAYIATFPDAKEIIAHRDQAEQRVKEETGEDSETAIMDAKYGFIHGALKEAGYETGHDKDTYRTTHVIDRFITNRYLGFPIFLLLLFVMFSVTFYIGQYPMDWIEAGVAWLGEIISTTMPDGPLKAMLVDGVIGGVGSVIVFLPLDAQNGSSWKVLYSLGDGLWLQCASGDGYPYHRKPSVEAYHHVGVATDELFGPLAYLYYDYRHFLCGPLSFVGDALALCRGYSLGGGRQSCTFFVCHKGRRYSFRYGAASLSISYMEGYWTPHLGKGQAIPKENGRHHLGGEYHCVGFGLFPP